MVKKLVVVSTLLLLCAGYASAARQTATKASSSKNKSSKTSAKHHGKRKPAKTSWKKKGQQGIQPERATEIQQALIREKYLTGEPSGTWDASSQAAMVKYQGDNGWQTKEIPDSRAIIKLGLGPNYSSKTLLNGPAKMPSGGAGNTTASRSANSAPEKQ
ncbi:MAG TPA: peptidoglycan-binding domain-containing protein [Candidatus Angelobacter sp.]|jgi:hypothetical protein